MRTRHAGRFGHAGWLMTILAIGGAIGLSGCQSWSQLGQPSGSRVAPPGTGTFQVPSNYYNGAAPKTSSLGSSVPTTNWQANGTASSNSPSTNSTLGVVPASAMRPALDQVRGTINNSANNIVREFQNGASEVVQAGARGATGALQTGTNKANEFIQNGTSRIVNNVDNFTDSAPSLRSSTQGDSISSSVSTGQSATRSLSDSSAESDVQLNWQAPR